MAKASLTYAKRFDPPPTYLGAAQNDEAVGDDREGAVYVFTDEIVLAVNVALVTGRPLLVRGASGTGKSSLARVTARILGWRYYERVITSRTQARDLLYEVDLLRRLHDAQRPDGGDLTGRLGRYVRPGVLWWAFDPTTAREATRASAGVADPDLNRDLDRDIGRAGQSGAVGRDGADPRTDGHDSEPERASARRAVVLLDEIDKADPDVPNNLLVPLGSLQFQVEETGQAVRAVSGQAPLVVLTTNEERALPEAFLRRCVVLALDYPDRDRLVRIAGSHFPSDARPFVEGVAARLFGDEAPRVSPAEFIDTVRAARDLGIEPDEAPELWDQVKAITLRTPDARPARRP
jgi:MoxR-like ATPase